MMRWYWKALRKLEELHECEADKVNALDTKATCPGSSLIPGQSEVGFEAVGFGCHW